MKFLSNFDTELEHTVTERYHKLYGKNNVLTIHRAKIFWVFFCLLPTIGVGVLVCMLVIFISVDLGDSIINWLRNLIGVMMIAFLVFGAGRKILKRYFDYKMDFCIITPQEVVSYNQVWFLHRTSRTIDADKIKTVTTDGSGLIKSLFNYGNLRFLSEWDNAEWGDITLNFVDSVNVTKNKIRNLIEPHLHKNTWSHDRTSEQW